MLLVRRGKTLGCLRQWSHQPPKTDLAGTNIGNFLLRQSILGGTLYFRIRGSRPTLHDLDNQCCNHHVAEITVASDLVANSMPALGKEKDQQRYDNFCPLVTPEMASIGADKQDIYISGRAASVNADQPRDPLQK